MVGVQFATQLKRNIKQHPVIDRVDEKIPVPIPIPRFVLISVKRSARFRSD